MKESLKKGITIAAISLSLLPQKLYSQIGGFIEATKGLNQRDNLRFYPDLKVKGFNLKSLIDQNDFWKFSKTDLVYDGARMKVNDNITLEPQISFHTNPLEKRATANLYADYFKGNFFRKSTFAVDPKNLGQPDFFTYNGFTLPIGSVAAFATGKIRDPKNTYVELEFTGNDIKGSGISPYIRANLQKGVKATGQVGLSLNPIKMWQRIRKGKR